MHLLEVIRQLSVALDLPDLAPDADGACALRVGELVLVLVPRPGGEAFVARARLGRIDAADFQPVLTRLLAANLFADGVGGPALGLDGQATVYLTQHFRHGTFGFPALLEALERFVAHARHCQAQLVEPPEAAATGLPPPAALPQGAWLP